MNQLTEIKAWLLTLPVEVTIVDNEKDFLSFTALKRKSGTIHVSMYGILFHRKDVIEIVYQSLNPKYSTYKPSEIFRNTTELKNFIADHLNNI